MTLYNVSVSDGAWRRGIFGALLEPVWEITEYSYNTMAVVALVILFGVLVAILRASWTARHNSQRLLIVAWAVSPLGAYLFHQVGYQDQLIYLLFFAVALAVRRSLWVVSSIVMTASVLLHEMTMFTTFPLWIVVLLLHSTPLRRVWIVTPPLAMAVVLLVLPNMSDEQVRDAGFRLQQTLPFDFRWDAVALFGRSLIEVWSLDWYSPLEGLRTVAPVALLSVAAVIIFTVALSRQDESTHKHLRLRLQIFASVVAVLGPFSLVAVGWDFYRWAFLGLTNFVVVVYVWLARSKVEISVSTIGLMLVPVAALFYFPLQYFDGFAPRPLTFDLLQRVVTSPGDVLLEFPEDSFEWTPESGIDLEWLSTRT